MKGVVFISCRFFIISGDRIDCHLPNPTTSTDKEENFHQNFKDNSRKKFGNKNKNEYGVDDSNRGTEEKSLRYAVSDPVSDATFDPVHSTFPNPEFDPLNLDPILKNAFSDSIQEVKRDSNRPFTDNVDQHFGRQGDDLLFTTYRVSQKEF